MGADVIRASVMRFGMKACTNKTLWTGAEVTLHVMIGFGTGVDSFVTVDVLFEATSFDSSASGS